MPFGVLRRGAMFGPWVFLEHRLAAHEAVTKRTPVDRIGHLRLAPVEAHARHPFVDAVPVAAVFAVKLTKAATSSSTSSSDVTLHRNAVSLTSIPAAPATLIS